MPYWGTKPISSMVRHRGNATFKFVTEGDSTKFPDFPDFPNSEWRGAAGDVARNPSPKFGQFG
jgi:hypothetical protein